MIQLYLEVLKTILDSKKMDTNQNQLFQQQTDNEFSQLFAAKQIDVPQEKPDAPIPDEPTVPKQPDENPNPTRPEPGVIEPKKNDPTRIDKKPPIFNKS